MVPDLVSLVAVMVTLPDGATPLTRPVVETRAFVRSLLVYVTVRPVSVASAASFTVAVSWRVSLTCSESRAALSETVATAAGAAGPAVPPPSHASVRQTNNTTVRGRIMCIGRSRLIQRLVAALWQRKARGCVNSRGAFPSYNGARPGTSRSGRLAQYTQARPAP